MPADEREVAVTSTNPRADDDSSSDSDSDNDGKETKPPIKSIIVILLVEMCERVTYYTIAGTQKTYLQNQMKRPASQAAATNSVFSMLCYLWCLPGGLLADSIGRYRTIIAAGLVYCSGTAMVGIAAIRELQQPLSTVFMVGSLVLIPLGTGGIKPNIANFGADQIGDESPEQRECQKSYFSWFYLMINVGVFIAFGYLANTTTQGAPYIGVDWSEGYFFAYGIGALFMLLAIGLFVSFSAGYLKVPGGGLGPFKTLVSHICYSTTHGGGWRAWFTVIGFLLLPVFFLVTMTAALMPAPSRGGGGAPPDPCVLDNVAVTTTAAASEVGGSTTDTMNNLALITGTVSVITLVLGNLNTNYIKDMPGTKSVNRNDDDDEFGAEEVREALAIVPLLIVVNIGFNLSYNAMNNAFPASACQMNTLLGGKQLNGAFFNIADAIAIIVFTPLFESCLYPAIARVKGSPVRIGQKIIAGLGIAALSNMAAAWLEIRRRHTEYLCPATFAVDVFSKCAPGYGDDGESGTRMKDISAFWIFVPFTLIGIAEILVNPCLYCLAYEAAPTQVRSLVQAFQLFCSGCLSNAFTAAVMSATYPDDLDTGHLESYYYINVILALLSVVLYFWLTRCFRHGEEIKPQASLELEVAERPSDIMDRVRTRVTDRDDAMMRVRSQATGRSGF